MNDDSRHADEAELNLALWNKKPLLRQIYHGFHQRIAAELVDADGGINAELGSGIGNIREVIPDCLRTDIFPRPWLDGVENAYAMSFADASVANLVLFDVFHHLQYPGTALTECRRVLRSGGRVILFEPCVSMLGRLVYGPMHEEPLGLSEPIQWQSPEVFDPATAPYYAAQGNAWRLFVRNDPRPDLAGWRIVRVQRLAAISYVGSGGYSGPQLYPAALLSLMRGIDRICDLIPSLFATRLLVVLEKVDTEARR